MSPCARCRLKMIDKDNTICWSCEPKYIYATTLEDGIRPPNIDKNIDLGALVVAHKGNYGVSGRWEPGKCRTPGCERGTKSRSSPYCKRCYERRRLRKKRGIDPDLPVRGGKGNPMMKRGNTRQKLAFDPVGA